MTKYRMRIKQLPSGKTACGDASLDEDLLPPDAKKAGRYTIAPGEIFEVNGKERVNSLLESGRFEVLEI